jgi:hypothetical protein
MISITALFDDIEPDSSSIQRIEESLNVTLPKIYCEFLKTYGAIDRVEDPIYGSWKTDEGFDLPSVIGYTKILRKSISLPEKYICISSKGSDEILLNTENGYLYQWHDKMKKILPIMECNSFNDYLKMLTI